MTDCADARLNRSMATEVRKTHKNCTSQSSGPSIYPSKSSPGLAPKCILFPMTSSFFCRNKIGGSEISVGSKCEDSELFFASLNCFFLSPPTHRDQPPLPPPPPPGFSIHMYPLPFEALCAPLIQHHLPPVRRWRVDTAQQTNS